MRAQLLTTPLEAMDLKCCGTIVILKKSSAQYTTTVSMFHLMAESAGKLHKMES